MNEQFVTLPTFYILRILELAEESGTNLEHWYERTNVREYDPNHTITLNWVDFKLLLTELSEVTQDASIGLIFGQRLPINTHGNLGFAAINSSTIRQAVKLLETYLPLRTDLLKMDAIEENGFLKVRFQEAFDLEEVQRLVIHVILLAIKNIFDFITIGNSGVTEVAFPFSQNKDHDLARSVFRSNIVYEQEWTGFRLPLNLVDTPLKMANPASFNEALRICEAELDKISSVNSFAGEVRKLILKGGGSIPSLELTAQQLNLTPRTLHRRLLAEETSYKQIVEDVRNTLAVKYLDNGTMDIQEIAYALNYSDTANFRRAFKRWQGVPPSQFLANKRK